MFRLYTKLINAIEALCKVTVVGLSAFFCIAILIQVIARRAGWSVSWTNELCTKAFVLMVFYGSVLVFKEAEHMSITVILERVPKKFQKITTTIIDLSMLLMCSIAAYSLFLLAGSSVGMTFGTVTAIKMTDYYIACGMSMVFSCMMIIWLMICTFFYPELKPDYEHQEDIETI